MNEHHDELPSFSHPVSLKLLIVVFVALVALTVITVLVNNLPLGKFDIWAALGIAMIKGSLVMLFFMHMWWEKGFNVIVFFSSLFFVTLFIGITLMDTGTYRDQIDSFPKTDRPDPPVVRTAP